MDRDLPEPARATMSESVAGVRTWSAATQQLVDLAIGEDLGERGDVTSTLLPPGGESVCGALVPRAGGVISGLSLAPLICERFARRLAAGLRFDAVAADGQAVVARRSVGRLIGARAAVLAVERTLLNFLGRMSGVATLTRAFVDAAVRAQPSVQVLDTRKTLPGWRELDKYAVRCGGGVNHRRGLYDAILIKDNHLSAIPLEQLAAELGAMLARRPKSGVSFVEVEVDRLEQLREVLHVPGIDVILLDNFSVADMRRAVRMREAAGQKPTVQLEASGGVTLASVAGIAETGVDRISVGALTHSAVNLDLGLDIDG